MTYAVVRADLAADRDEILKFWHNNHRKPLDRKFQWMYQGNPHGRALVWLIKHGPSEACVGMAAVFPRRLSAGGRTISSGIIGDFLIHEAHRTAGPAVKLMRSVRTTVAEAGIELLYGFPNRKAEPILKRAGFQRLGGLTRLTRVLKTRSLLKKRGVPDGVAAVVSPIADWALRLGTSLVMTGSASGLACREVRDFDARYSDAWRASRAGVTVTVERSPEYLTWKYLKDPDDINRVFAVFNSSGEQVEGYLVCRQDEDSIEIREIVGQGGSAGYSLIAHLVWQVRALNSETIVVTLLENEPFARAMERLGFRRRPREGSVYWYGAPSLVRDLSMIVEPDKWLLMLGDQDT